MREIMSEHITDYLTPEGVKVDTVFTGFQAYHGETLLGHVARVFARDNSGVFRFLPPRITIGGEKYYVTSVVDGKQPYKLYFKPFQDDQQFPPCPEVKPEPKQETKRSEWEGLCFNYAPL